MHNKNRAAHQFAMLAGAIFLFTNSSSASDLADAQATCGQEARSTQRLNLSSGMYTERAVVQVPLDIDIPLSFDTRQYSSCMVREGFDDNEKIRAEFDRLDTCAKGDIRPVRLTRRGSNAISISSEIDDTAYARCVAAGAQVEVEISNVAQ